MHPIIYSNHTVLIEGAVYDSDTSLEPSDRAHLRRMSGALPGRWFVEWIKDSRRTFTLRGFVGTIHLPSGRALTVVPKLFAASEGGPEGHQPVVDFIRYLQFCRAWPAHRGSIVGKEATRDVLEVHISEICKECLTLFNRGLFSRFRRIKRLRPAISGKIDFAMQTKKRPFLADRHFTSKNELSRHHEVAAFIKFALSECQRASLTIENKRALYFLLSFLIEIPDSYYSTQQRRPVLNKAESSWQTLLVLLEQFLRRRFGGFNVGVDVLGEHWLFETQRLFERYVESHFMLSPSYRVIASKPSTFVGYDAQGNGQFRLIPDLLVKHLNGRQVIVECKWKVPGSEAHKLVEINDVRQLLVYLIRFNIDVGVLLYPGFAHALKRRQIWCEAGSKSLEIIIGSVPLEINVGHKSDDLLNCVFSP